MMRLFKFESDIHVEMPLAVRRKLDLLGIKVGLKQWLALGRGERLAICHLPVELPDEREALSLLIKEAVQRTGGETPQALGDAKRAPAVPPAIVPAEVAEKAAAEGVRLDQAAWQHLDADERYTLVKLTSGKTSHNFAAALAEFLPRR